MARRQANSGLKVVGCAQARALLASGGSNDKTGLLRIGSHTCITHDPDSEASGKGGKPDSEASTKMGVARVCRVLGGWVDVAVDDDGCDETIDTQDTGHDNWDDGAHHHVWPHHTHGHDADTRLRCAVGCAQVSEDDCRRQTHEAKECRGWITHCHSS